MIWEVLELVVISWLMVKKAVCAIGKEELPKWNLTICTAGMKSEPEK